MISAADLHALGATRWASPPPGSRTSLLLMLLGDLGFLLMIASLVSP